MAATIQTIQKPTRARALDTSGNNNHGQIYSGRALEFDGVTDYLEIGETTFLDFSEQSTTSEKAWTVAAWINFDAVGTLRQNIIGSNNNTASGTIAISSNEKLYIYDHGSSVGREGNTILHPETWYRAAWVFNGIDTVTFYLNGVADGTGAIGAFSNNYDLKFRYIGAWDASDATPRIFKGKMSDLQLWQRAWTADDVLYDYNNPEQLALNRGGTLLTNSNLKAWYPMNDGHRGQQSYILDASNTGLGDELCLNGDFSDGQTGWDGKSSSGHEPVSKGMSSDILYNGNQTYKVVTDATSEGVQCTLNGSYVTGVMYKIDAWIYIKSGVGINLNPPDSHFNSGGENLTPNSTTGEWENIVSYIICTSPETNPDDAFYFQSRSGSVEFYIGSMSIKPVNDKNHATTVFYGDEMITSDYVDNGTFTNDNGDWAVHDPESTSGVAIDTHSGTAGNGGDNGGLRINPSDSSTEIQGVKLTTSYFETLVPGKTYRVSIDMKSSHAAATDDYVIGLGGTTSSAFNITTSYATYTKDIVATSDADLLVYSTNASSRPWFIDNVSVKEIGIASGWTDADQQLDIPQTALQSYNQLAWFPGEDPGIDYDVTIGADSDINDIFDGGGTVSAWIYPVDNGAAASGRIINKASGTEPTAGWYIRVSDGDSTSCKLALDTKFSSVNGEWISDNRVIKYGQWTHVAINWNDDSDSNNATFFVNGESVALTENGNSTGSYSSDSGRDLLIGNDESGVKTFHGVITEVSLWDVGLSTAQVQELYNDGKALDATTHSLSPSTGTNNLKGYWRNNGKAPWIDLSGNGNNGNSNNLIESILITPGVDGSRDSQGFIMNRQKTTNSLNFYTPLHLENSLKEAPYVFIPKAPLMTDSTAVTNFSICAWVKYNRTPNQASAQSVIYDDVQETNGASYPKGLKLFIGSDNVLKCRVWHGYDNSTTKDFIYSQYDLDNIDNATITDPHSFGADGMWNGTQTSMAESKGIAYPADDMLSGSFPPDKWFHIAVTFDHDNNEGATNETANPSSNITVCAPFYTYVNGILVAKNGIDGNDDEAVVDGDDKTMQGIADHAAIIGSDMMGTLPKPGNNVNDTHGEIDELLMYSDTLTSKEVLRIYNAGKRSHK